VSELQPITESLVCARCDGDMVITHDAIGRPRRRCPRCDGVAKRTPPHPDDVFMPQGLVRANGLPAIAPGQVRFQRCAHGITASARFCVECVNTRLTAEKTRPCPKCGRPTVIRRGRPPKDCEACR
jgi:hypothetical protein